MMKKLGETYGRYQGYMENIIFPLILVIYPLLKINQGIDVSDTTYSLGNFQYFGSVDGTWMVATFLANAAGSLLMRLPFGGTLMGMYFYTALFQSVIAAAAYGALRRRIPAPLVFLGEFVALGLCWCPSVILYNYLTYLLMTVGVLLLYGGALGEGRKRRFLYTAAGVCLGANVAVRMPNVVQAAFILTVWYGAVLEGGGRESTDGKMRLPAGAAKKRASGELWRRILGDTLWCLLGYAVGFGIPLAAICVRYGAEAYPSMVQTLFAMTEQAEDYQPASMVTGMLGDYLTGIYWLLFAGLGMAVGWVLMKARQTFFPDKKAFRILYGAVYGAVWLALLRFYWGRGMFSFRYYEYSSMYYPTVLLLLLAICLAVSCLLCGQACKEKKLLAAIVLVQILVTPLGSNNALYPIINNLFLAVPFVLWVVYDWFRTGADKGWVWKAPCVLLCLFVLVQSIGFHRTFVFQDGIQGESRTMCVTAPRKAASVYTSQENGELLQELAEYAEAEELAGRAVILYGDLPGLGYLLDMPPALSTFWPDLDSYRMAEYEEDMARLEETMAQKGGEAAPVIILASPVAAYLSEDADAVNWFGADREAMEKDEKLRLLDAFMKRYGYQEQFCNARYAVYVTENQ